MSTVGGSSSLAGVADPPLNKKKKRTKKKKNSNSASKSLKKKVEAYVSSEEEDYSDDEEEGKKGYRPGGYHPVQPGDIFNSRYLILEKLGWGHFSTVWLCRDSSNDKLVALKVVKSAKHYSSAALDEIKILKAINTNDPEGKVKCIHLVDSFEHKGPNGKHVCMAFQLLGSNLLELIKRYNYRGIPAKMVKHIIYDVLTALDFLHTQCHVIHTDLKPENVLLENVLPKLFRPKMSKEEDSKPEEGLSDESEIESDSEGEDKTKKAKKKREHSTEKKELKFKDLSLESKEEETKENKEEKENKRRSHESMEEDLPNKTRESLDFPPPQPDSTFLTPVEAIEEDPSTYSSYLVDLGNACWVREHFTDEIQTRQYRAPEVIIGAKYTTSVDMWSVGCLTFELLTGDLLFEPKDGTNYDKDDDHLAQMIEVLGEIPKKFALSGKNSRLHFNASGELRFIKKLTMWGLREVLEQKYGFSPDESNDIDSFLKSLMEFVPEKRFTAAQMLKHKWLSAVVEGKEAASLTAISSSLMASTNSMSSVEESVLAFSTEMKLEEK